MKELLRNGVFGLVNTSRFVVVNGFLIYQDGGFDIVDYLDKDLVLPSGRKVTLIYDNCRSFEQLENRIKNNITHGLIYKRDDVTYKHGLHIGDLVELTRDSGVLPKGLRGRVVKFDNVIGDVYVGVDFLVEYDGSTHSLDGKLSKPTGRYINKNGLKKVD